MAKGKTRSPQWEELSAAEFRQAIEQSTALCLLPFGILEKHGPQLPLGTDLLNVRYAALHAAERGVCTGVSLNIISARFWRPSTKPGTVAYSRGLQLKLLQETTDEMARNGCKKVVIVNGHGGNESLLPFFAQPQLKNLTTTWSTSHMGTRRAQGGPEKKDPLDMHAGQTETSTVMISRPDLVHMDRAASESGADQKRLNLPNDVYTGIWWYARFPNHYSGDGSLATHELGEFEMKAWINAIAEATRAAKADDESLKLQNEFYEKSKHPLDTRP